MRQQATPLTTALSSDQSRPSKVPARGNQWVRPFGPPLPDWKGHLPLGTQQCAYCKQEFHWRQEYPNHPLQIRKGTSHTSTHHMPLVDDNQ